MDLYGLLSLTALCLVTWFQCKTSMRSRRVSIWVRVFHSRGRWGTWMQKSISSAISACPSPRPKLSSATVLSTDWRHLAMWTWVALSWSCDRTIAVSTSLPSPDVTQLSRCVPSFCWWPHSVQRLPSFSLFSAVFSCFASVQSNWCHLRRHDLSSSAFTSMLISMAFWVLSFFASCCRHGQPFLHLCVRKHVFV